MPTVRRADPRLASTSLESVVDSGHLVWIGFSFADRRVAAIVREVADKTGTRTSGMAD
jgi:hypothetical protein